MLACTREVPESFWITSTLWIAAVGRMEYAQSDRSLYIYALEAVDEVTVRGVMREVGL